MSQIEDPIEELQSRITAAMDRIGAGVTVLADQIAYAATQEPPSVPAQDHGDSAELAAALDEEKLANAQLEERLKALKLRHAAEIEALNSVQGDTEDLDALKAAKEAAEAGLETQTAEVERLTAELADLSEAQSAKAEAAEGLSAELDTLKSEVGRLKAELEDGPAADPLAAELEAQKAETEAQSAEVARLTAELAAATAASATANDEMTAELEAQSALCDKLRGEAEVQAEAMARLDMDVQRLRQSNDQLREVTAALREANEQSVGEPHLINKAMLTELEGLRAARATDVAEAGAVLSRLEPLLAAAGNLPEGEEA